MSYRNLPADLLTASRILASALMPFFPAFSGPFWALYLWCGLSDMIDGPLARRLNASSPLGSALDSAADMVFVVFSAVILIPCIRIPVWIWVWTALIGLLRLTVLVASRIHHGLPGTDHSQADRLAGLVLFLFPFLRLFLEDVTSALIVVTVASLANFWNLMAFIKEKKKD